MHAFLRKISQAPAVREAILFSAEGKVLLRCQGGEVSRAAGFDEFWPGILSGLAPISSAVLRFTKGCYCLRSTPLGVIVVGMAGDTALLTIGKALENVEAKLADPEVCRKVLHNLLPHVDEAARRELQKAITPQSAAAPTKTVPLEPGPSPLDGGGDGEIREALQRGDKQRAIFLVMEQITLSARAHRFERAERLRDWLLEIDSMALVEGVRAAEMIEEEKAAAIGPAVQAVWQELLNYLSREEFAALYFAGSERRYADGEVVVRQGEFLATLFLVNSGQLQVTTASEGRQMLLKSYGPGEIVGGETFFDASVWTVNLVSRGASIISVPRLKLLAMKESQPALYGKIQDYCGRYPSTGLLFQKSRRTRRAHERRKAQGRVSIDLLDAQGGDTGVITKGELLDLSRGGVSLSLRFSKKKSAAALLGHHIRVHLRPKSVAKPLAPIGKVMAIRCHDYVGNEYSLHIQFAEELSASEVLQLTTGGRDHLS